MWHDGFHLVNSEKMSLTHLSQYLSPSLPTNNEGLGAPRPTGARHMTALLASNLEGIDCVGLLTHGGEISIFERGVPVLTTFIK